MHSWIQADLLLLRLGFFIYVFHIIRDRNRKIQGERKRGIDEFCHQYSTPQNRNIKERPRMDFFPRPQPNCLKWGSFGWDRSTIFGIPSTPEGFEVWVFNLIVSHTMQLLQIHHGRAQSWSWSKCAKHEAFQDFEDCFFFDFNVGEEKIGRLWNFWFAQNLLSASFLWTRFSSQEIRIGAERAYLRGVGKIQINGKLTSQEAHVEFLCPR